MSDLQKSVDAVIDAVLEAFAEAVVEPSLPRAQERMEVLEALHDGVLAALRVRPQPGSTAFVGRDKKLALLARYRKVLRALYGPHSTAAPAY